MKKDEQIASEYIEKYKEENMEKFEKLCEMTGMDTEEYVEEIGGDPRNWFPFKIRELFEQGFNRMGIIASNVYAESVMDFWTNNLNKLRKQNNQISKTESQKFSKYSYADRLDIFRELGIIEDSTYGTLKRLNSARNDFAHEIDSHNPENKTEVEKEMSSGDIIEVVDSLFVEFQEGFTEWASEVNS